MKEDILEQMVDDWLLGQPGYFTKHNLKFKPEKESEGYKKHSDAVNSDIDILGVQLVRDGKKTVRAVSCKSYQGGFNPKDWWNLLTTNKYKKVGGREAWKHHRELCIPKWGKAFSQKIFNETGSKDFTYTLVVAILSVSGDDIANWKIKFENEPMFIDNLKYDSSSEVKIEIITAKQMFEDIIKRITGTVESTQFGRLIQVLRAAGSLS